MKKIIFIFVTLATLSCTTNAQQQKEKIKITKEATMKKTDAEWKEILTPDQYYVLRQKGTDRPGNGGYTQFFDKGTYVCAACGTQLFESGSKYESHCGWPSFDDSIEGTVVFTRDTSAGMVRTEITCATCGGHLGHIFNDGPKETTGQRYCVNTTSIKFVKADAKKENE